MRLGRTRKISNLFYLFLFHIKIRKKYDIMFKKGRLIMKRKIKNIILITILVLGVIGIFITLSHAKNNLVSTSGGTSEQSGMHSGDKNMGTPPDMNSSDSSSDSNKPNGNPPSGERPSGKPGSSSSDNSSSDSSSDSNEQMTPPSMDNSSSSEKADGGFAGAGETTSSSLTLTTTYIIIIGIISLIISLDLLYLVMSGFSAHSVFINSNKIIIYVLANIVLTALLTFGITLFANKVYLKNSSSSNVSYSSTDDLHIDMSNWSYDSTNNVYYQIGLVYVSNPATKEYESMGIYVPGDYMDCSKSGDTYKCTLNETNEVAGYTSKTAPIVMPINTAGYSAQKAPTSYSYNGLSSYLEAGFIYVYSGARGRNNGDNYAGGAPWGVTDFKAAIRYLRYNASNIAGDENSIFVFGHSGGGAQSTILGASGDSELYTDYLNEIGALMKDDDGNEISDSIKGVMAWCPITNLDVADAAYEWNMGQYATSGTRADSTWTSALSDDLAEAYAKYINELKLKDNDGNVLSLSKTNNGVYTSGTYYNYLKSVIEESLTNYLNDNYTSVSDMKSYASKYSWVTFNESTKSVTITNVEDFVKECKSASKDVGAFDDLNRKQAENYVFGNSKTDALHFDSIMSNLLNSKDYSSYSDYDSSYASEYKSDLSNKDDLGKESIVRQNMYNPMYYLTSYYDGYKKSTVAPNWRIRTGITQGDTATVTEMNLALALNNYGKINVDFATIWAQGHTTAERTGNSTTNFISWVNESMK